LGEHTQANGEENEIGTGIEDYFGATLKHDEVEVCSGEGVCGSQSNRPTTDDDSLEGFGSHFHG